MEKKISRRSFLKGTATGAAAFALGGLLQGCTNNNTSSQDSNDSSQNNQEEVKAYTSVALADAAADTTLETDVVVVGIGVAGIIAAAGAADKGAKVIALDRASGFGMTNNVNTTGAWHIESSEQMKYEDHLTKQEAFERIMAGTNYQCNAKIVRSLIEKSGRAIDIVINSGMPLFYPFSMNPAKDDYLSRGGHVYLAEGTDRIPFLENIVNSRENIECHWSTEVTNLVTENDGVCGVLAKDENGTLLIKAKSVVVCTGGFLQNKEMVAQYYGGAQLVPQGNIYNDGAGIQLTQAAGAQMGKNFSISMNEMGAANFKARPTFSWAPGRNTNVNFYLPNFGLILLDKNGERFMNEQRMCEATMYSGEQALRESVYYTVVDQDEMDRIASTPVMDFLGEGAKANMGPALLAGFEGVVLTNIYDDFETAVKEGWAFKADTLEELAEHFNAPKLKESIEAYNHACDTGIDEYMYTPADYLVPVKNGPFYMIEFNVGAWLTLGGIKCDGNCAALRSDNSVIPGLFVAGADADLWSVPYFQGGSALGFCYASGLVAGEAAAENAL